MSTILSHSEPQTERFEDDGSIPNNPSLPLLLYRCQEADPQADLASYFEQRFTSHDWQGCWRNGIHSYHHYHSITHEALGVYAGEAEVQLGGERGRRFTIRRGDLLVIPAGVGHKRLSSSDDFGVVGAYPGGKEHDLLRGESSERPRALENIQSTPLPESDPLYGAEGPLTLLWKVRPIA